MTEVNDSADGREIELSEGDELRISLDENPTTGFAWAVESLGEPACDVVDDHFESGSASAVGSGGVHRWRLKAKEKGEGKIALGYRRSWESKPPLKTFKLTVRVK